MRRPPGNSWKMDSTVQSSLIHSWSESHVCIHEVEVAVACLSSLVHEMSWEILHPSRRQRELLAALCWLFPGTGEGCTSRCLFQGGGIDSGWSPRAYRYVTCKGGGWPHILQQGWSGPKVSESVLLAGMNEALYRGEMVSHLCPFLKGETAFVCQLYYEVQVLRSTGKFALSLLPEVW